MSRGSDNVIYGGAEQHQAVLVLSISSGGRGGADSKQQQTDVLETWRKSGCT